MLGASFSNIIFILTCGNVYIECFKCEYYFKYDRAKNVGRLEEDWKRLEEMAVHKVASLDISTNGNKINHITDIVTNAKERYSEVKYLNDLQLIQRLKTSRDVDIQY